MHGLTSEKRIDFICIGAAKSGTTWLYHQLGLHPDIALSKVKEVNYFNKYAPENPTLPNDNYGKPIEWYHSHFPSTPDKSVLGEFSTSYLKYENCANDLFEYNPNLKLIALLRNPVERLYSHYLFLVQRGIVRPSMSFEDTIDKRSYMLDNSMYFKQLSPYFSIFPEKQINIYWYEDLLRNADQLYAETLSFLDVKAFNPENLTEVVNPTLEVKNERLNETLIALTVKINKGLPPLFKSTLRKIGLRKALSRVFILNSAKRLGIKAEMNPETRKYLLDHFMEDIERLEALLGKDLSDWKY